MFVAPEWDVLVREYYAAAVGNHALTTRWTYTVPAGRFAVVEYIYGFTTDPAALGDNQVIILALDSASAAISELLRVVGHPNQWSSDHASPHLILDEGEKLRAQTINSGAGVETFRASAHIREIGK